MGWNEPEKGKDSWKGNNQPPDLDEILRRLKMKLQQVFSVRPKKPTGRSSSTGPRSSRLFLIVGLVLVALWVLSGIFIVDPAEQAVILRFGRYIETVGPGPHWIPRIISSKIVMNVDRVLDYSYSAQMLTRDENLVSVSLAVQYRINDLEQYLFNVANPEESLKQATSSALRQVVGTTTLDQIITEGREIWGNRVQDGLIKTLALYKTGILIVNVAPQPARAPESVQEAFDDAIKAQEDEKRFKEQAYAYTARVVPIAQGNASRITQEAEAYAKQVVLRAKGEVAGFLALLPQYLAHPEIMQKRMYLDTMQQILSKSSKILVDSKSNNLLYLPLAQLINTANLTEDNLVKINKKITADAGFNEESSNFPLRSFTRPTYDQGRE
jgi:membrane protease subunit HflK